MITLSEAYRKLNNKNTSARRRINENEELDYPLKYARSHTLAELVGRNFAKYFQFCDKPSDSEYDIGDMLHSKIYFEGYIVGFVEPKPAYKGKLKPFYYLRGSGSFFSIVDIVDGFVEYLSITDIKSYLGESVRRPAGRRINEAMQSDIPAPFNKYFKISDYEPDEGEYQIGERVDDYEIAAYLEPKDQYDGLIELYPFLLKGKEGFIVGDVSFDRVYYIDGDSFVKQTMADYGEYIMLRKNQGKNDKMGSLKYESRRRNTRCRRVNEARIKVNDNMIPAALRQYFTISDYEPQLGEYQIGDVVDQNEVLAYLEPTPEYKDTIQIFPLLLKPILPPHARRGVYSTHPFVANVIHDRVYYVTDDDIHAELGESIRRPTRRLTRSR